MLIHKECRFGRYGSRTGRVSRPFCSGIHTPGVRSCPGRWSAGCFFRVLKPLKSSLHFFNCVEAALSGSLERMGYLKAEAACVRGAHILSMRVTLVSLSSL